MWRSVALRVRSPFARHAAPDTPQTVPDSTLDALLGGCGDPVEVLRGRVYTALLTPPTGCPVCGDPTGVRCCEYGAERASVIENPWLSATSPGVTWDPRVTR